MNLNYGDYIEGEWVLNKCFVALKEGYHSPYGRMHGAPTLFQQFKQYNLHTNTPTLLQDV